MSEIKKILEERGFLYQYSSEEIFKKLDEGNVSFYCGFDPTADSLHLGNFMGFMCAVQLMLKWNTYYALIGWATGMIGDPGWKDAERSFLSEETLRHNEACIWNQYRTILSWLEKRTGKKLKFEIVNNYDFYTWVSYLDFLREVGKYHTVNQMMAKDTVKKRIEDPTKSISYTEFSYMLLQGFDFYYLNKHNGLILQVGWQDQWGNLVTWVELIRKKAETDTYVFTWPLLVDSAGKKFGKSEGNALFLDKNKTSPYKIYQYFINTLDTDVERFLKILTLLEISEIQNIIETHTKNPELRFGQKRLALEVVKTIHSEEDAMLCEKISDFLFSDTDKVSLFIWLSESEVQSFYTEVWGIEYTGQNLFELFVQSGLEPSNSTARQTLQNGGMFLNEIQITDGKYDFSSDWIDGKYLLLRKGKKSYKIVVKK
jgi:tyrosyl-tRNA synthetase